MSHMLRNLVLLLIALSCLWSRAYGSSLASITVGGAEQQISGVWDTNTITISFNGFVEAVQYAQFSTPASVASAFAAMFSRDYLPSGLCANASGAVINFKLKGNATFGQLNITGPTTSFQFASSGFAGQTAKTVDTGTVTLTVNGNIAASTNYGDGATPASIAQGLASGVKAGSFVTVSATGDDLYLESKQTGSGTNYSYSIQTANYDSADFSQPSFAYPAITGQLGGGANAGTSTGVQVYSYAASYDPDGNVTAYSDSVMGTWNLTGGYDTLNRLIAGHATSGPYNGQYECWSYDSFGNRTAQTLQNSACPTPESSLSPTAAYNAKNQVTWVANTAPTGFTYDAAGNVTADNMNTYLYDAEGRICAVRSEPIAGTYTMTGYIYDADGNRVAKGSITAWSCDPSTNGFQTQSDYILGSSGEQMTEMAMDTDGSMYVAHNNVWAGGKLLATYDGDGALHFYLTDPLGTRRVQTDYAGVVEQNCQSLPYGDGESCSPSPTEHLFTGKERDQESGNDYFGARYYASTMGRWLSPDKPFADQHTQNPQSWNLYAYARNNPLIIFDPNGEAAAVLVNGNNVTIYFPVSFSGNANTPANQAAYTAAITAGWTGQFGGYNVTMHVIPGDPGGPLTNDVHINAPTQEDGAFPRPTTDVGGPNMNLFGLGNNAAVNDYETWASGHEAGHAMGEQDKYHDVVDANGHVTGSVIDPGYQNNIMAVQNGVPDARDVNNILAFPGNTVINTAPSVPLNTETPNSNQQIQPIQPQLLQLQPH